MRPYDLLIFDWDGTLADTANAIVASMQQAITDLGLPPRSDREISTLIGLGVVEGLKILYPERSVAEIQTQLAEYRREHPAPVRNYGAFFAGAESAVRGLHADGYSITVATGKSRAGLEKAIDVCGLRPLITASRTMDQCPSKPAPDMIEELLWETDTPPARALMVGDTEYDLAMAQAARVHAVGVLSGVHDAETLNRCKPQALLDSVADLPDWLQRR